MIFTYTFLYINAPAFINTGFALDVTLSLQKKKRHKNVIKVFFKVVEYLKVLYYFKMIKIIILYLK